MLRLFSFASSTRLRRRRRRIWKNLFYEYYTHTTSNYIKFLIGVNFYGDLHLDISRYCIKMKLKVKIGISSSMGNTLCNPYIQGTTIPCDEYYTHTTSYFVKFLIGINFCGDLHLDASRFCLN